MPRPLIPMPGLMPYTPVLPKLYWEAITPEQELHELCKRLHTLFEYSQQLGTLTTEQMQELAKLQAEFEKFKASGFEDYYEQQLAEWIRDNAALLFQTFASQVFFGINDDGYFCAYVPESWSDITFDTGAVYGRSDYGRLILRFTADGSIDNSYSYSLAQSTELDQLIADLEVNANRTDETYDAVFTNVSEVISSGNF